MPVPPVVLASLRPHHQVRRGGRQLLVAAGAPVGPTGRRAAERPHDVPVLDPLDGGDARRPAVTAPEGLERGGLPGPATRAPSHRYRLA